MPLLTLLLLLLTLALPAHAADTLLLDNFEQGLGAGWTVKEFKGQTTYTVESDGASKVLHALSNGTASGLVLRREFDLHRWPVLSWRWKVAGAVAGGDERQKSGDDYAARVYVVFPHWFFPKTRSINYIWANRLAKGEAVANPFTANTKMLAVQSGSSGVGQWHSERRNVLEDYRRLFGEEPPLAGAIAVMTDTDNTGQRAEAWYDDLQLER